MIPFAAGGVAGGFAVRALTIAAGNRKRAELLEQIDPLLSTNQSGRALALCLCVIRINERCLKNETLKLPDLERLSEIYKQMNDQPNYLDVEHQITAIRENKSGIQLAASSLPSTVPIKRKVVTAIAATCVFFFYLALFSFIGSLFGRYFDAGILIGAFGAIAFVVGAILTGAIVFALHR